MIEAIGLRFAYADREILKGVDFYAKRGEVVVLMGRNGAGKTTLLKHLNGLLKPKSGRVVIDGVELKYDRKSLLRARRKVLYVFQNPDDQILAPTVWQDVAFGPKNLGLKGEELERVVREALKAVGLEGYENRLCSTLSGGEKRRLAIASAIAMDASYYLLDEPSANVDGEGFKTVVEVIEKLRSRGKGIVVSTHDVDLAKSVGDRFCFMEDGRIVWEGESFDYSIARKLKLRSFALGKIIVADKPIDSYECFYEPEKALLRALEGKTVVLIGEADGIERYPVEIVYEEHEGRGRGSRVLEA
ncbi:MAG: ATP-binding cassette domain-containing protein [Archaeoglobaceae archaeon]